MTLSCPIALEKERTCTSQWVCGRATTKGGTSTGCLASKARLGKFASLQLAEELTLNTIRRDEACLDFAGTDVILYPCHGSKGNQYWQYRWSKKLLEKFNQTPTPPSHTDSTLRHGSSRRCLAIAQNKEKLQMEECSEDNPRQQNDTFIILRANLSDCLEFCYFLPQSFNDTFRQRWRFQNYDPSKEEHR